MPAVSSFSHTYSAPAWAITAACSSLRKHPLAMYNFWGLRVLEHLLLLWLWCSLCCFSLFLFCNSYLCLAFFYSFLNAFYRGATILAEELSCVLWGTGWNLLELAMFSTEQIQPLLRVFCSPCCQHLSICAHTFVNINSMVYVVQWKTLMSQASPQQKFVTI